MLKPLTKQQMIKRGILKIGVKSDQSSNNPKNVQVTGSSFEEHCQRYEETMRLTGGSYDNFTPEESSR